MADSEVEKDALLRNLAHSIKSGHCILFLGAGVHAPPPQSSSFTYDEEYRPPTGGELSILLAQECGFVDKFPDESPINLQRVSLCYELTPGLQRKKLIDHLRVLLRKNKKPSPILIMLMGLPFQIIVTTNYDDLAEQALRRWDKEPEVFVYNHTIGSITSDMSEDPTADTPMIFKMHGDLAQRDQDTIVITDEDYINFIQRMTEKDPSQPVPQTIRYRMAKWPTLFVGYSLQDYNLRLLFRTLRWRIDLAEIPPSFSIDRKPDPLILKVWQDERKFITFVTEDIWSFVPRLYKLVTGKAYSEREL